MKLKMWLMKMLKLIIAAFVALPLLGCGDRHHEHTVTTSPPPAATNAETITPPDTKSYLVRGVVKKIEPDRNRIVIDHEEIPDYMAAMTMPFRVSDAKVLEGVQPGDTVWFWLWTTEDDLWIEQIRREKPGEGGAPPPEN
jgi:Cu/Ag efflux protein CusF